MNILFLTLAKMSDFACSNIYTDLIRELANNGNVVYVLFPCEMRSKEQYYRIKTLGSINLVPVLIPNYYNVGLIRKGIATIAIEPLFYQTLVRVISDVKFDLILYSTPPITFCNVVSRIKKRDKAKTFLLLKDIWPQGLIDLGVLSNRGITSFITHYYKRKEKKLYAISDKIGCMSKANVDYLLKSNPDIRERNAQSINNTGNSIVLLCPNSIKVTDKVVVDKSFIREKFCLPQDKVIFVYGGNFGAPQGIDFIIECLKENEKSDRFILLVGNGTHYSKLNEWISNNAPDNCRLMKSLPHDEYMELMAACDVGLIFLDHSFSIPNYPSRVLSYMQAGMPVLASTDLASDIGCTIEEGKFGAWCESNDSLTFVNTMKLFDSEETREEMGNNAYKYLYSHFSVERTSNVIISKS